jgi:hypothetical protein
METERNRGKHQCWGERSIRRLYSQEVKPGCRSRRLVNNYRIKPTRVVGSKDKEIDYNLEINRLL